MTEVTLKQGHFRNGSYLKKQVTSTTEVTLYYV